MKGKLSVSLMCADLLNLGKEVHTYERTGVDYIHVDMMDSKFVPNLTFGPDVVNAIKNTTTIPLDIHLLMNSPRAIIRSLRIGEGDIVTIHAECKESIMENVAFVKQAGARFGLALNPDTTIEEVKKYLPYVDVILLMLIVPGFAGSKMIHGMMQKVDDTRAYLNSHGYTNIEISVDGSVSRDRAQILKSKGASIFVGGTAGIYEKGRDINETIILFKDAIKE